MILPQCQKQLKLQKIIKQVGSSGSHQFNASNLDKMLVVSEVAGYSLDKQLCCSNLLHTEKLLEEQR